MDVAWGSQNEEEGRDAAEADRGLKVKTPEFERALPRSLGESILLPPESPDRR